MKEYYALKKEERESRSAPWPFSRRRHPASGLAQRGDRHRNTQNAPGEWNRVSTGIHKSAAGKAISNGGFHKSRAGKAISNGRFHKSTTGKAISNGGISQIHHRKSDFQQWISQVHHRKSDFQHWISHILRWKSDFLHRVSRILYRKSHLLHWSSQICRRKNDFLRGISQIDHSRRAGVLVLQSRCATLTRAPNRHPFIIPTRRFQDCTFEIFGTGALS